MTENVELIRALNVLALLGVTRTACAAACGINAAHLSSIVSGEKPASETITAKLESFVRATADNKLAAIAQYIALDGGCPLVVRAMAPSVRRLARELDAAEDGLAHASGWPRRLTPQEQAERMARQKLEIAEIETREEAERAAIERGGGWGTPPSE